MRGWNSGGTSSDKRTLTSGGSFALSAAANFSGGTVGNPAAGFVDRWHDTDWTVETDAGSDGGKSLQDSTSAADRKCHSWETPGVGRDMEVLVEVESSGASTDEVGAVARGVKSSAAENGIAAYLENGVKLTVREYHDGTTTLLGAPAFTWSNNTKYTIRLRVNSTDIKARVWASADAEPGAWTSEQTTLKVVSGFPGIYGFQYSGAKCHRIAVAYGGGTAAFS